MTTLRFSMTTLASRALGMEAVMRGLTDCFGRSSGLSVRKSTKSCDVNLCEQIAHLRNQIVSLKDQFSYYLLPEAVKQCSLLTDRLLQSANLYAPEEQSENISSDMAEMEKIRACILSISSVIEDINRQCKSVDSLSDEALILRSYANLLPGYIRKLQMYKEILAVS